MESNVEFMLWFAGLIDGEGCFFAQFYPTADGRLPLTLRAEVTLRADDRDVLEYIASRAGGKVVDRSARGAWNPTAKWVVSGREECVGFVDGFSALPLRSKKSRDFETWKKIVAVYAAFTRGGAGARSKNLPLIEEIQRLIIQLQEGRQYIP